MGTTIRDIVTGAQTLCGEVAGAGVQAYGEDRMFADAIRTFDMIFTKYPWPQYRGWTQHTLDGTTGMVDADAFDNVRGVEDFIAVHREDDTHTLPVLPTNVNPFSLTGTALQCWTFLKASHASFATRRLQFYPITATDTVTVLTRDYPIANGAAWDWTTEVEFDKSMMEFGVAFMTMSQDDLNPGGADVMQKLMELRFSDITTALSSVASHSGQSGAVPSEWHTLW